MSHLLPQPTLPIRVHLPTDRQMLAMDLSSNMVFHALQQEAMDMGMTETCMATWRADGAIASADYGWVTPSGMQLDIGIDLEATGCIRIRSVRAMRPGSDGFTDLEGIMPPRGLLGTIQDLRGFLGRLVAWQDIPGGPHP